MFRVLFLIAISFVIAACTTPAPPLKLADNFPLEQQQRGKQLAQGLAACGFCHGEEATPTSLLVGGRVLTDRYGEVVVPNLSPSSDGLKDWSSREILSVLRSSRGKDDVLISSDFHQGYEWISDKDALAIIAYIRSMPAVENGVKKRRLSFVDRNTKGLLENRIEVPGQVPPISSKHKFAYGGYLVDHVARCGYCHTSPITPFGGGEYLEGGKIVENDGETKVAPAISGSRTYGIGSWEEKAIAKFLKTGEAPGGHTVDARFCPIEFFANAEEKDLEAIAHYLVARKE